MVDNFITKARTKFYPINLANQSQLIDEQTGLDFPQLTDLILS